MNPAIAIALLVSTLIPFAGATLQDVCSKTYHPDICVSSIQSFAGHSLIDKVSFRKAAKLQIHACVVGTRSALNMAEKLSSSPEASDELKKSLDTCIDGYSSSIDSLKEGLKAINKRDESTAGTRLSATFAFYDQCTDNWVATQPNPMERYKETLRQMAGNAIILAQHFFSS